MNLDFTNIHQMMDLVFYAGTGGFILAIIITIIRAIDTDDIRSSLRPAFKNTKYLILLYILFCVIFTGAKFNVLL